jgi:hypothetical protein
MATVGAMRGGAAPRHARTRALRVAPRGLAAWPRGERRADRAWNDAAATG